MHISYIHAQSHMHTTCIHTGIDTLKQHTQTQHLLIAAGSFPSAEVLPRQWAAVGRGRLFLGRSNRQEPSHGPAAWHPTYLRRRSAPNLAAEHVRELLRWPVSTYDGGDDNQWRPWRRPRDAVHRRAISGIRPAVWSSLTGCRLRGRSTTSSRLAPAAQYYSRTFVCMKMYSQLSAWRYTAEFFICMKIYCQFLYLQEDILSNCLSACRYTAELFICMKISC